METGVWSPGETLDSVLSLASLLKEAAFFHRDLPSQRAACLSGEPGLPGSEPGRSWRSVGSGPASEGPTRRGREAGSTRTPAPGAPGGTPSLHGCRAQSPCFWEGSWFLSAQESAGPVGSQEDVHGDGRTAVFLDLKRAAPGNPSIFCLQVPDGAPESGCPEDTVSPWTWPECQKRTQICRHHVRALARVTAAKRGAGPLSRRRFLGIPGLQPHRALRSSAGT